MTVFWEKYRIDCIFILLLALFSFVIQYGRLGASIDGIALATDPSMYTSIIASRIMPDAFVHDVLLSNDKALDLYRLVHFPLIASLVDNGKVGLAYLKLTGVHVFLHYLGFYLVGLMLLKKRWQAVFFTLLMGQTYWVPWGTYWGGGYADYTPRSTFSALYGFMLCVVLASWNKARWWPLIMFAAGLMVYVHSISALAVLAGLWLGFAVLKPPQKSWMQHGLWMLLVAACGLAALLPYVAHFIKPSIILSAPDVDLLKEVVLRRFDPEFTFYWQGMGRFFWQFLQLGLIPLYGLGIYVIHVYGNPSERRMGLQIIMWSLGPIVVTLLFLLDQYVAFLRQAPPLQFDLIRTLRFLPFFFICMVLMALNVVFRELADKPGKALWAARVVALGVGIGLFLGGNSDLVRNSLMYYWNSADNERYEQAYANTLERRKMLEALQKYTPVDACIFSPFEDEAIRHYAHRSLVFAWKDVGSFYGAKILPALRRWLNIYKQLQSSPTAYIALAGQTGADYLLSDRPQDKALLSQAGEIVWESKTYVLVHLRAK